MFSPAEWWYRQLLLERRLMGQLLHGSTTKTEAVRRAIQAGQESVRALARHYGIGPTTVQKWRRRSSVSDATTGPEADPLDRAVGARAGRHRGVPPSHSAAARRQPLCAPARHPGPDPLIPTLLSAAPRR